MIFNCHTQCAEIRTDLKPGLFVLQVMLAVTRYLCLMGMTTIKYGRERNLT